VFFLAPIFKFGFARIFAPTNFRTDEFSRRRIFDRVFAPTLQALEASGEFFKERLGANFIPKGWVFSPGWGWSWPRGWRPSVRFYVRLEPSFRTFFRGNLNSQKWGKWEFSTEKVWKIIADNFPRKFPRKFFLWKIEKNVA
jgi:hypothetical protein